MSDERVSAALAAVPSEAHQQFMAMLETEPVGRLFDGAILRWIVNRFGGLLQGLTAEQIGIFLMAIGIPQPWASMLAQAIYAVLHPPVPAT